jgi:sugar phosphate isomerase/epimerase
MMRALIILFCLVLPMRGAEEAPFAPAIYPFQNGVNFGSLEKGVRAVKELGYAGIGSVYPRDVAGLLVACEGEGLKVYSVYVGGKVNADGYEYGSEVAEAINHLKGTGALVELNVQRGNNPNDEQAVAFVREIAGLAKEAGLKVVLYPHANFHIERVDHAVRIAKATGMENVGVAFNLCHFLKVQPGDDLGATLRDAKPWLWSVSICGADADGKDWGTLIRPLDEGTFDQAGLLGMLREIGYSGAIGLQCFNIKIDAKENLSRSMVAWRKLVGGVSQAR